MLQAGKLDKRIRIEFKQVVPDPEYGTETITWAEFATVWAQVQDVLPSKAESQVGSLRISERPARVRIRYRAGIDSTMRVIVLSRDNRVYQIVSGPAEIGCKVGIEFMMENFSL